MRALALAFGLALEFLGGASAQDRASDLIQGVWDTELLNADGTITTELEIYGDGTYEGYRGARMKTIGQIIAINGVWSVRSDTGRSFELTLKEDAGETLILRLEYAGSEGNELIGEGSNKMIRSRRIPSRERPPIDAEEA